MFGKNMYRKQQHLIKEWLSRMFCEKRKKHTKNKMINKGTMRNVKKGLGIVLFLIASGFIFNIQQIQNIIMEYPWISYLVLGLSGYFLIKSGAQS